MNKQNNKEQRNGAGAIERRYITAEARAIKEGEKTRIGGLAAVYNRLANIGNWFVERIEPGFFDECDMGEAACLFNHDQSLVLGRVKSGTLELKTTDDGLDYTADPPSTRADVVELIERGDVYQSSFAFTVKKARWEQVEPSELAGVFSQREIETLTYGGKIDLRVLEKADRLYDVSPVTFPAYKDATVGARSLEELEDVRKERQNTPETEQSTNTNWRLRYAEALERSNK